MMVLSQLHRNVNQTARKEHSDNIKLVKDCTVTIVCRKIGAIWRGMAGAEVGWEGCDALWMSMW